MGRGCAEAQRLDLFCGVLLTKCSPMVRLSASLSVKRVIPTVAWSILFQENGGRLPTGRPTVGGEDVGISPTNRLDGRG